MMTVVRQMGTSQPVSNGGVPAVHVRQEAELVTRSFHQMLTEARQASQRNINQTSDSRAKSQARKSDPKTQDQSAERDQSTEAVEEPESIQPDVIEQPEAVEPTEPADVVTLSNALLAQEARSPGTMRVSGQQLDEQPTAKRPGSVTTLPSVTTMEVTPLSSENPANTDQSHDTAIFTREANLVAPDENSAAVPVKHGQDANHTTASRGIAPITAAIGDASGATTLPPHPTTMPQPQANVDHPFAAMNQANDSDMDAANVARVARGLQSALQQNGGSVTLRLHPPELGFVRIEMQVSNGTVSATLQSEQPQVRELLHQQLAQLRHGLESHGLNVERLQVQGPPNHHNFGDTSSDHRAPSDDGRSRGHFTDGGSGREQDDSRDGRRNPSSPRFAFADLINELA